MPDPTSRVNCGPATSGRLPVSEAFGSSRASHGEICTSRQPPGPAMAESPRSLELERMSPKSLSPYQIDHTLDRDLNAWGREVSPINHMALGSLVGSSSESDSDQQDENGEQQPTIETTTRSEIAVTVDPDPFEGRHEHLCESCGSLCGTIHDSTQGRAGQASSADAEAVVSHTQSIQALDLLQDSMSAPLIQHRNLHSATGMKAAVPQKSVSRRPRKSTNDRLRYSGGGSATAMYIAQERNKFEERGLSCPGDVLVDQDAQGRLEALGLGNHKDEVQIVNFIVGSCDSLAVLVDVLRASRQHHHSQRASSVGGWSATKRLQVIREFDTDAAYSTLLKNFHITKFYTDKCCQEVCKTGLFIVATTEDVVRSTKRPRGNPQNLAAAELTRSILRDLYPDSDENSSEYSTLYNEVKSLRRFGRRLNSFVETFGVGILGLIPLAKSVGTAGLAFSMTNTTYVISWNSCTLTLTAGENSEHERQAF